MNKIEISARTVEEALTQAMLKLNTTSERLGYEVVSEGKSGILGLFSKPAVIKAWVKEDEASKELDEFMGTISEAKAEAIAAEERETQSKPAEVEKTPAETTEADKNVLPSDITVASTPEEFITQVCNAMGIQVSVDSKFNKEENVLDINMIGDDMGILIGKRGQTLDSLQYLTGLVANKNKEDYVRVKLDTENYRERRKETLENLARNIAFKVKRTKKPVALEPMNPYERRVIHAALQNDKFVVTRSEGEEPFRHVVISLKREKSYSGKSGKGGYNRNGGSFKKGGYNKRKDFKKDYKKNAPEETGAESAE